MVVQRDVVSLVGDIHTVRQVTSRDVSRVDQHLVGRHHAGLQAELSQAADGREITFIRLY